MQNEKPGHLKTTRTCWEGTLFVRLYHGLRPHDIRHRLDAGTGLRVHSVCAIIYGPFFGWQSVYGLRRGLFRLIRFGLQRLDVHEGFTRRKHLVANPATMVVGLFHFLRLADRHDR